MCLVTWLARSALCLVCVARNQKLGFLAIFAVSLTLRCAALLTRPPEVIANINGNEAVSIALSLHRTGSFANPFCVATGPTAHCSPLFPLVVSWIFDLFGTGLAGGAVRCLLIIVLFSALYASLPTLAALLRLPVESGFIAGMLGTVLLLYRATEVWNGRDEAFSGLVLAGGLVVTLRIWERHALLWRYAILWGALWGTALYTLPSLLPVGLLLLLLTWRECRVRGIGRRAVWSGLALLSIGVVALPWAVRNRRQLGAWVFTRDNLGLELYVSNADRAQPDATWNQQAGWFDEVHPNANTAVARRVRDMGEPAFNRDCLNRAMNWITSHPRRFAELTAARTALFWFGSPRRPWSAVLRTAVLVLAILGLRRLRHDGLRQPLVLFLAVWIAYPLVYYVVQYSDRYASVIGWSLLLPAGYGIWQRYRGVWNHLGSQKSGLPLKIS